MSASHTFVAYGTFLVPHSSLSVPTLFAPVRAVACPPGSYITLVSVGAIGVLNFIDVMICSDGSLVPIAIGDGTPVLYKDFSNNPAGFCGYSVAYAPSKSSSTTVKPPTTGLILSACSPVSTRQPVLGNATAIGATNSVCTEGQKLVSISAATTTYFDVASQQNWTVVADFSAACGAVADTGECSSRYTQSQQRRLKHT